MKIPEEYLGLIVRHLQGLSSESDKSRLMRWLEENPSMREEYASMAALYKTSEVLDSEKDLTSRMLSRLNARIDSEEIRRPTRRCGSRIARPIMAVCAAAAAMAAAFFVGMGIRHQAAPEATEKCVFTAYSNQSSDVSAIMLDDSTRVWLGTNSSLLYGKDSLRNERVAKLTGDAYFDVHHDASHPFIVKTGSVFVKVLGTAFCVRNDNTDGKVSVILERGSVRLMTPQGVGLVRLSPDQMAEMDTKTGDLSVEPVGAAPYIVQHYNKVALQQAMLSDIISHIERMYGVRISQPSCETKTKRYDLNYKRTDSVEELIEIVDELTGVRLEILRSDKNNQL